MRVEIVIDVPTEEKFYVGAQGFRFYALLPFLKENGDVTKYVFIDVTTSPGERSAVFEEFHIYDIEKITGVHGGKLCVLNEELFMGRNLTYCTKEEFTKAYKLAMMNILNPEYRTVSDFLQILK